MTRAFWVLWKREMGALLLSPIAYVLMFCMLLVNGFTFVQCVHYLSESVVRGWTIMQIFFFIFHFWFALMILTPAITMRSFAEEYRNGTIEPLLTAPVLDWDVVLSKFFASVTFYVLLWLPPLLYLGIFQWVTGNQSPVLWGPLGLSYLMVVLVGMFYISVGIFASSLTRNQIIAAVGTFTLISILFFSGFLSLMTHDANLKEMIYYVFTIEHMRQFSNGYFDSRPLFFYLSGTAFFLLLTHRTLAYRRLKS
jgi:ABC-2 type transport system permease protein